jgi:2-methylcitrate dehydratase PrpD
MSSQVRNLREVYVPDAGLLTALGRFAHQISPSDLPEVVVRQAKLSLLDTIGCIVAGADMPEAGLLLDVERLSDHGREASVFCSTTKLSSQAAARVNAYMGDIFELNDLTGGHASIGSVPAGLALVEGQNSSGADLLKAVVAGIEITSRIYGAYYSDLKPYTETGITPPGFLNSIGAAAAASILLGLDERQTAESLAIAGALAGWCPSEVIFGDGGTVKPMLFGAWPASVGIMAANYAKHGITGPGRLLESDIGFFATTARRFNSAALMDDRLWYLAAPRRKMHACCGYIHSALDVLAELRRQHGTRHLLSGEIHVGFPAYIIPAVSKTKLPVTPNEARFHAQYCLALVALGADRILPEHSARVDDWLRQPDVQMLMKNIRIASKPELKHYHQCTVEVRRRGEILAYAEGNSPKGSPSNPMSDDEVINKFATLAKPRALQAEIDAYVARILALEQEASCEWIFATFA